MRVESLTPVVAAAPGDRATCLLRIENTETGPVLYRLRVVGFDESHVLRPAPTGPLAAGASEDVALEFVIPDAFAAGHHSVAVEVSTDRPGSAPVIAAITVTVGTIDNVAMAVVPSTIRGRRRGRFRLDIDNRALTPIELDLAGEGPDLRIRLRPERVILRPGERVRTSGKVKAPRHLVGEPRQHSLTVTARSRSSPSYAPATFNQRPLFPRGLRSMLAVLLVVGIWAGAIGAGYLWWTSRQEDEPVAAPLVDTDGDGQPDTPGDQMIDTDGDGVPDTMAAVVAEQVAAGANDPGPPQAGGSDAPTRTVMGGSVKAPEGDDASDVTVTLIERDLGAPAPAPGGVAPLGFAAPAGESRGGKLWPARFGRYRPAGLSTVRQTESIQSVATGPDGAWLFTDVAIGQSHELSFAREGYDTQSFVVTPSADGEPVEVDVDLQAARGAINGVVVGPNGPLGNVDLVLSDGVLTFNTSTASEDGAGTFSMTGLSTPGTYTLSADLRGFGTEVVQLTLDPGEERNGVRIGMQAGVGSISGRVTENGEPLGGVTLTASNGDVTRTTTSLTEGDRGRFTFPQLDIPGRYTVTASLEGYLTQTRLVTLSGNVTGVDFDFVKTTGGIIGLVESSQGGPLTGTNIRVSRDDLVFDTTTAVTPDPGSFSITDLPPGTYLVEFSRFDHAPFSQTVTVAAGQVVDLGTIVLQLRGRPDIPQNGRLEVRVVDSQTAPLTGARVRVFRVSDGALVAEQADAAGVQSTFLFQPIAIGTYRIEVDKDVTYRPSVRRVSIGLGAITEVIPLFRLGQVSGRLIDSFIADGIVQLRDYDVQILRINPDGSPDTLVQSIPVPADAIADDGPTGDQIRWESAPASLTSGQYRVNVVNPPPGYRVVPDQVLVPGLPPMRFDISPTSDAPIDLGDIQADRFPWVEGTVLAPQLGASGAVTFAPIEADNLTVELTCPGTGPPDNSVVLDAPRPPTPPGGPPLSGLEDRGGTALLDSFFFDHVTLDDNDLSGACTLTVNADGFEPSVVPVIVEPGDGSAYARIFRNIAMIKPETVGGTAHWVDDGVTPAANREAVGVTVRTQGNVIIDFEAGETMRTDPGSEPEPVLADTVLTQTTGAGGAWAFVDPRQVFGSTNYVFDAPGRFTSRILAIQLSQDPRQVTAADGSTLPIDATAPAIAVQLDAVGGLLTANADVRTIKGTPASPAPVDVSGFSAGFTGANTATVPLARVGGNVGGVQRAAATLLTPDPGTHQVAVTSAATVDGRPRFDLVSAQPAPFLQQPGTPVTVGPVTFVERGAVDVRVNDIGASPISGAVVDLVNASTGATFTVTTPTSPPGAANVVVGGLPVNPAPGATTPYTISLDPADNPELDLTTATLQLFNENGALIGTCGPPLTSCGSFSVAQGGQPRVVIRVERYGSITGSVLSDVNGDGIGDVSSPLVPPPTGTLSVVAERIGLVGPAFPLGCVVIGPDPARAVTAVGNSFRFSGPPGLYRIRVTHPLHETTPISGPPQVTEDLCVSPDPELVGFVFRVTNDDPRTLTTSWTLRPLSSQVTVDVRNDQLTSGAGGVGTAVPAASVSVTRQGTTTPDTRPTGANGQVVFPLIPGAYDVTVTKVDPSGPAYFPITFSLSIVPGGVAVLLEVPLPRIGGAITGDVIAVNSRDRTVPVPAGVQITRAYDPPDPRVSGATVGTVPNPAPAAPITAVPAAPGSPPGTASTYSITSVASGVHTLSFNDAGGAAYEPPDPIGVTVLGLVTQPATDAVYVAENRSVVVTVGVSEASASPDGALVRLVDPVAPAGGIPQAVGNCTGTGAARTCTTTFTAVAPELANYEVEVTKERYGTVRPSFAVPPGNPATPVTVSATIVGTVATVSGVAEAQNAPTGAQVPLPATGLIELLRVGQSTPVDSTPPAGNGSYTFQVEARGTYQIRASAPGYAPRTLQFVIDRTGGNGDLGSAITLGTVSVPRLATFAITVTPADARPGAQVQTIPSGTPTIAPATTTTATGFTVAVDPGTSYQFTITSPNGFVPITVPTPAQQPAVGATVSITAAMQPRTITGTVSGASAGISVRATSGATTIAGTVTGSSYTITQVPNGTWTVEAAAFGSGRGVSSPVPVASTTPSATGIGVTLAARQVAITFTVSPATAAIALTGGASDTASGGTLVLDHPETGFPVTWRATADGFVPQSAPAPLPAAPADPFVMSLSTSVGPITLVRPVVTATVLPPTGTTPVTDATVHLCSGATGACAAGTAGAIAMPFAAGVYSGTPTSSGPWRVGATRGTEVAPPVSFTVSAEGAISVTLPISLTLAAG